MSAGAVALAASCALRMALGDATFYDVSLRTEARGRNRAAVSGVLGEAEADPRLGLTWMDQRGDLGAAYFPRLMVQEQGGGLQVLHRASVDGSWQVDGNWRALASAEGSYGTNDLLLTYSGTTPGSASPGSGTPAGAAPASGAQAVQPIPQVTTLKYLSGQASVGAAGTLTARSRALARVSAFIEGGADGQARTQVPLQHGGRLASELEWSASRSDALVSALGGTITAFPGILDGIVLATETWRHALTQDAQVRLGAGPAVTAHRAGGNTSWNVMPGGEIGVHDRWLQVLEGDLGLRASPIVDRTNGAAYERADANLSLTWRATPHWTFAASGTAGIVVQGSQAGDKIAAGDFRAAWSPTASWELAAGMRGVSQMPHAAQTRDISEASVFVAVTVRDRDRL